MKLWVWNWCIWTKLTKSSRNLVKFNLYSTRICLRLKTFILTPIVEVASLFLQQPSDTQTDRHSMNISYLFHYKIACLKKGSMKYSLGRHLYATSMNFLIPGHGSPPNVFGDDKNLHRLFFWHASTTIWSNEYWKESKKKGRIEINLKCFFCDSTDFFFAG